MAGGAGNDVYFVDDALDMVIENRGEGTDAVFSTVSHTLAANVETLVLQGSGDLAGTGNALNNHIYGNSGANTLNGGGGADLLVGECGQRHLRVQYWAGGRRHRLGLRRQRRRGRDALLFAGYGAGATFTNIDATHWQINYSGGSLQEIITFMNGAVIDPSDVLFS